VLFLAFSLFAARFASLTSAMIHAFFGDVLLSGRLFHFPRFRNP